MKMNNVHKKCRGRAAERWCPHRRGPRQGDENKTYCSGSALTGDWRLETCVCRCMKPWTLSQADNDSTDSAGPHKERMRQAPSLGLSRHSDILRSSHQTRWWTRSSGQSTTVQSAYYLSVITDGRVPRCRVLTTGQ